MTQKIRLRGKRMGYEIDINRAGSSRLRQEIGLATTARSQGREGASAHYRFYELEPALVVETYLTEKDATKIGTVKVRPLYSYASVPDSQLPIAVPLDSNIKSYPLKNEIVIVAEYAGRLYYTQRLNFFNLVNQNIVKDPFKSVGDNQPNGGDYTQTSAGNPNQTSRDTQEVASKGGKYFTPDKTIRSLLPLEGDIIYEGRFGNSIRFGGTVASGNTSIDKRFRGTWATGEAQGSPILIIRNGQGVRGNQNDPYIEDINKDASSLYLTTDQLIPLQPSTKNFKSYNGTAPSKYDGKQAILCSDRVILNARKEEVLLFSPKSIGLSTEGTVNIDSTKEMIINSRNIYLGLNATQHILLGDKTTEWMNELLGYLNDLVDAINQIYVQTGTGPSSNVQTSASPAVSKLVTFVQNMTKLQNKTQTLLSKQNYTL